MTVYKFSEDHDTVVASDGKGNEWTRYGYGMSWDQTRIRNMKIQEPKSNPNNELVEKLESEYLTWKANQ